MRLHRIYIIIIIFLSCNNKTKSKISLSDQIMLEKNKKNLEYYMGYSFPTPYEIKVNDMVVDKNLSGGKNGAESLNQYILNKGEQNIEIKVIHPFFSKGGVFKKKDIKHFRSKIYLTNQIDDNMDLISEINFPDLVNEIPVMIVKWKFNADLSFELEGWKNSKDLTKFDEGELKKRVFKKFSYLRDLLNKGNTEQFIEELKFRNNEFFKANYFETEQKVEYLKNLQGTFDEYKGNMLTIDNYVVRILGGGKAVTIENISNKYKGECLVAENVEEKIVYLNYIVLHIPYGRDDFEVLRINPLITSLDN